MKQFKLIIDEHGENILNDRVALEEAMRQKGCDERDIHTIMLILATCPKVADQLIRQEPTERDVRFMMNSCCALTGLNISAVRRGLGMLMYGCGYTLLYAPRLSVWRIQNGVLKILPEHHLEAQTVQELIERIQENSDDSAALSDLATLSEKGNPNAAYFLGCLEENREAPEGKLFAVKYFREALESGFGPANGAVADSLLKRGKKHIALAARSFERPASLYGREGRQWKSLAHSLRQYRTENKKRLGVTAIWQGVVLATSIILIGITCGFDPLGIICLAIQALALLWTCFCLFIKPYMTSRISNYALMLSWLLLAVCVL